jgi:hypothetical protein
MARADELARKRQALQLRSDALRMRLAIGSGALSASVRSPLTTAAARLMPLVAMLSAGLRAARLLRRSGRG